MEQNNILQLVYTFFLGILLAIFIGVGISTFYSSPERPEYPVELNSIYKEPTKEQEAKQIEFEEKSRKFDKEILGPYNRNVSIIALFSAVFMLFLSLVFQHKIKIMANGIMLGGFFTLLYSLGRGFASQDSNYTFIAVTIGLVVALFLGYTKFVKTPPSASENT
jgi:hypothetical protein